MLLKESADVCRLVGDCYGDPHGNDDHVIRSTALSHYAGAYVYACVSLGIRACNPVNDHTVSAQEHSRLCVT